MTAVGKGIYRTDVHYNFDPTPGPKHPEKYPNTGSAYQHYGELPGWKYNYITDTYFPDPAAVADVNASAGIKPEEKPTLTDQILPVAAAGGAYSIAQTLGKEAIPGIKDVFSSTAPSTAQTAAQTAQAAQTAAPVAAQNTGLIGVADGGAPAAPVINSASEIAPQAAAQAGAEAGGQAGTGLIGMAPGSSMIPGIAAIPLAAETAYNTVRGGRHLIKGQDLSLAEQAALALPTFGTSFLFNPIGDALGWGDQDKWQTEGDRLQKLKDSGTSIPDNLLAGMPTHGRSTDELTNKDYAADFVGRDSAGNWLNNKFASSRNVADLRGEDIVNYGAFAEKDPTWFSRPLDQRISYANQALAAGAIKEHHGTVDVDWQKAPPLPGDTSAAPQGQPPQNQGLIGVAPSPNIQNIKPGPMPTPQPQQGAPGMIGLGSQQYTPPVFNTARPI